MHERSAAAKVVAVDVAVELPVELAVLVSDVDADDVAVLVTVVLGDVSSQLLAVPRRWKSAWAALKALMTP